MSKIRQPAREDHILRELGSFERALVTTDRYAPFHIVSTLQLDGAPAPDIVRAACGSLQKRHPLLAARIVEKRGRYNFEAIPNPSVSLSVLPRQHDEDWIAAAERELSQRIDSDSGPLFRATYLWDSEGGRAEIILTSSHSILDSRALMLLWHELLLYSQELNEGHTPEVPVLESPPAADDVFPQAFRGVSLARRTFPFVLEQIGDEINYRRKTRGKAILPLRAASPGHILTMRFSPELTEEIARCARVGHVTLNTLLNAAMLSAINLHLYSGQAMPMRTFTFANLRPYVMPAGQAPNLSPYISMMRFTVMVDPARGLWGVARDLHAQIAASFRRGHKFIAAATSDNLMKMLTRLRAFRMANTAMNYNGPITVKNAYGAIAVRGVHGTVSPIDLGPEYAAQVSLFNDELWWDITYMEADMDQALAQTIADEIRASLGQLAADAARISPA